MNLFGKKRGSDATPATPPSLDQARERVRELRRGQALRGRASAMLTQGRGGEVPTATRKVTGN